MDVVKKITEYLHYIDLLNVESLWIAMDSPLDCSKFKIHEYLLKAIENLTKFQPQILLANNIEQPLTEKIIAILETDTTEAK